MADAAPSNLVWLSRLMAWLSAAAMVLWPIGDVFAYLFPGPANAMDADHLGGALNESVPIGYRLGALFFSLAAMAFVVWALWSLRALFNHYARGEVFSPTALGLLNRVAAALFASVVVGFVMHAPITLILSWPFAGHRTISLDFGTDDFVTLFCAGVVLVIARVMGEAHQLADENAKFV